MTATCGCRVRIRATSCAAVRLPPPWVKKSAFGSDTATPRISAQPSASQPSVGVSSPAATGSTLLAAGSGHGSASRSTLPDVRVGRSSTTASSGTSAAGSCSRRASAAVSVSSSPLGHHVPDQHLVAGPGAAHGRRRAANTGQREQRGVDLAQLDAPPAQLDLLVGAPEEEQPGLVGADDVAAAVGAVPAERRQRSEPRGVPVRVEVAGEADPADHQLAALAHRDRLARAVDDGELPAVERHADPHRPLAGQLRGARDDGGLGRPVGVPHLAALDGEPLGQLGRARLAAEDQQPHLLQRVRWPQRGERRDGGDDRDALRLQPRPEVDAGAHQRPRRRAPGRRRAARPATSPRTRRRTRPTAPPARGHRARSARRRGTGGPRRRRTPRRSRG